MSRIAANPIPYWSKAGKTREVFEEAFRDFQDIGFTAVKADVPDGMTASEYREWISSYGLSPSLSLFNSPFDETVDMASEVEKAKRFAASQTELGLDRTMVSSMALPDRIATPAVGAGFDEGRLARAIDNCGEVCRVLQAEGLRPLHHSHVGGVFETEYEITRLLDDLGPDVIGAGPDTGHLRWAGIDPAAFIRRYADRVGGIHIKDCFPDLLGKPGLSYPEATATKRLWAEPGLGVVDFDAVLAAIPDDYDGDFMIEVDEPSVESKRESHQMSFEWAQRVLRSRVVAHDGIARSDAARGYHFEGDGTSRARWVGRTGSCTTTRCRHSWRSRWASWPSTAAASACWCPMRPGSAHYRC